MPSSRDGRCINDVVLLRVATKPPSRIVMGSNVEWKATTRDVQRQQRAEELSRTPPRLLEQADGPVLRRVRSQICLDKMNSPDAK